MVSCSSVFNKLALILYVKATDLRPLSPPPPPADGLNGYILEQVLSIVFTKTTDYLWKGNDVTVQIVNV